MRFVFLVWVALLAFMIHSFSEGNWADGSKALVPVGLLTAVLFIVNAARRLSHQQRVVIEVHHTR